MRPKIIILTILLCIFTSAFLFAFFSLSLSRDVLQVHELRPSPAKLKHKLSNHQNSISITNEHNHPSNHRHVFSVPDERPVHSILLPDWEILLTISSPENSVSSDSGDQYFCLFQNNATSPANFAGILQFSGLKTYRCILPNSLQRYETIRSPILTKSASDTWPKNSSELPEMLQWNFLTYESLSTESDLILFVKGVNNRQGFNRPPSELRCVFNNGVTNSVITAVTISAQEVFRCLHPNDTEIRRLFRNGDEKVSVSLQVQELKSWTVPSVAYYSPPQRNLAVKDEKALLCACTMVYNVAKVLKEWVIYNSKIGVEKFILYDNGSEDDLQKVVDELLEDSYKIEKIFWPWPKTQEAGFSHCAMNSRDSCTWMMYTDVDEFIFSPKWLNSSHPSQDMLRNLLPSILIPSSSSSSSSLKTGQVSIDCLEYGPSNQKSHPIEGVTQGYTCRRRLEQRHKSIVLLDAIDTSLLNVIHHFQLKDGYRMKKLSKIEGVVNHYKYQAWSEFKVKFRRRVSAYVVDWKTKLNPASRDRTPGLGFEAIKPKDWDKQFCEVHDNRLKVITQKWFGSVSSNGYKMVWQDK
ncbi:protein of unknown function DUF23 [Macleaya cordata]|uniref:Glycosyltransferase family 92 protein n=1 Tax=Macleaya cordata TaxID=56857 RepID=A0A200RA24_MACCD|nr:protein of unknown function DUF23 [Macleaya cordata]